MQNGWLRPCWRTYLQEYVDYGVCDFLEFGWPVGFDYSRPLPIHSNFHNHKGATEFPAAVDAYLSSKRAHHAVIGPFSHNPFSYPVESRGGVSFELCPQTHPIPRSGELSWISAGLLVLQ